MALRRVWCHLAAGERLEFLVGGVVGEETIGGGCGNGGDDS